MSRATDTALGHPDGQAVSESMTFYVLVSLSLASMTVNAIVSHISSLSCIHRFPNSIVRCDFLDLAISLLARFANDPDPVQSHLLIVSLALYDEQHQAGNVLEFDNAQVNLCGTRLRIPVFL